MSREKVQKDYPDLDALITRRLVEFAHQCVGSERGWQSRFADFLSVSQGQVGPYLRGEKLPGMRLLKRLSLKGCDLNWLIGGEQSEKARRALSEDLAEYFSKQSKTVAESIERLEAEMQILRGHLKKKP